MKRSFTGVVVLLAGACVAYSQGSVVFGNYAFGASRTPGGYMYVELNGTKIGVTGGTALGFGRTTIAPPWSSAQFGDDWSVTLYGAPVGGTLADLIDAATGLPVIANLADGTSDSLPGTWFSGDEAEVPGVLAPGQATIQYYAWYNGGGTITLAQAMASRFTIPWGASATGTVTLGGISVGAPLSPVVMPNLGSIDIALIPEPSTIALGVLVAFAFLLCGKNVVVARRS
jgi:hypothetical protein